MSEKEKKFKDLRAKFDNALAKYSDELDRVNRAESLYSGTMKVKKRKAFGGGISKKEAECGFNAVYRLIESEVDPTVPKIRVDAIHEEDQSVSEDIQAFIRTEFMRIGFDKMNDMAERICAYAGGVPFLVEWNPNGGYHDTLGECTVKMLHPNQLIPQPGVTRIEDCEYIFILTSETKKSILRTYGVSVEDESEEKPELRNIEGREAVQSDELVTKVDCYFWHDVEGEKTLGVCSWAGDTLIRYESDYYARKIMVCTRCGLPKTGDVCECGCRKFKEKKVHDELIEDRYFQMNGGGQQFVPAMTDGAPIYAQNPDGSPQFPVDETGNTIPDSEPILLGYEQTRTQLPCFKPKRFPVLLRTNISKHGQLLGVSDALTIETEQDTINKTMSQMMEKVLSGGSIVNIPAGVKLEKSEHQFKVTHANPNQVGGLQVINVQPNIDKDISFTSLLKANAQEMLGLTNSFLGQADTTATSGTAKQFSANQSAARLSSRRMMKYAFTADLAELILQTYMAFGYGAIPYSGDGINGERIYGHFNQINLIKADQTGELYWNTEFVFSVDESATVASNHEQMWNMMAVMYQAGAFGQIGAMETNILYWKMLKGAKYPGAGEALEYLEAENSQQMKMMQGQIASVPSVPEETTRNNGVDDRTSVQPSDLVNLSAMGVM